MILKSAQRAIELIVSAIWTINAIKASFSRLVHLLIGEFVRFAETWYINNIVLYLANLRIDLKVQITWISSYLKNFLGTLIFFRSI